MTMIPLRQMLEAHPEGPRHVGAYSRTIAAALECATICSTCADACLSEHHGNLTQCIRLDLDCADICSATTRVLSRASKQGPQPLQALLGACASACRACAEECRRHEQHSHCRICAESCETCEAECEELLKDMHMAGQRDAEAEVPPTWARGTV